jgi:hypothetical protein
MRQMYLDTDSSNAIEKISFFSANEGNVAFDNWIGYTTDSGRTFSKKYDQLNNVNYGAYTNINVTFGYEINGVKAFDRNNLIVYGDYGLVKAEAKLADRKVYKLTIEGNPTIIQGLLSISDYDDHIFMHLIESAPYNFGKPKLYEGVPGNLVAYACRESVEKGHEGFVAFVSKTKLMRHYEESLGAHFIGGQRMAIGREAAAKLINQYFKPK